MCRFLLTETRLCDAGRAESALTEATYRAPRGVILQLYRLVIEHSDFDPDFYETMACVESFEFYDVPLWLRCCVYEDCIRLIQQSQSSSYFAWPLQQRIEFSMFISSIMYSSRIHHLLVWIGVNQITRELALYQGVDGETALHMVAGFMARNLRRTALTDDDDDVRAAIDLISLGADLSAVWAERTPFMQLILILVCDCCPNHAEMKLREAINLWRTVLQRCKVDLRSYARTEQAIWRQFKSSGCFVLGEKGLKARRIVFDENSGTWELEVLSQDLVPIYESHSVPGAWVPDTPEISKICWKPSGAERNDCKWVRTDQTPVKSHPWIVGEAARKRTTPDHEILLTDSQDDHGIIALKVNKRKPSAALRRRGSMPHLLGVQAFDRRCRRSRVFRYHPWLPMWHLCPYDGKLLFDCEYTIFDEPNLRACAQGASIEESCVQETGRWDRLHFDGEEIRMFRRDIEQESPVGLEDSSFLTDDGRWVSTETWKTIKVCEPRPWWCR